MLWWPPDVNTMFEQYKFEQVSSDGHQMSLVGVGGWGQGVPMSGRGVGPGCPMSGRGVEPGPGCPHVPCLERRGLNNEVPCIMGPLL